MNIALPRGRLTDLAEVVMGQSPRKEFVNTTGEGLPLLNGPTEFGPTYPTPVQWTTKASETADRGDILFCVRGSTTGRMNWADQEYAIGRGIAAIRAKTRSDTVFVQAAIRLRLPELLISATGSTFPNVSGEQLRSMSIPMFEREEREAIAATLGALDDKIESNRRASSVVFGLLDSLSEKHGNDLPATTVGGIALSVRRSVNPVVLGDTLVDHFSLPAFDSGTGPERVVASTIKSNKFELPSKSVLVSRLNPRIERIWWANISQEIPALASTEFVVLTAETDLDLAAIWLAVRDPYFRDELPQRVTGTSGSHQRVRPDDVLSLEVPNFREASAELLSATLALLKRADALRVESARLTALRDTLLPELMSGRIRAPEAREVIDHEVGL